MKNIVSLNTFGKARKSWQDRKRSAHYFLSFYWGKMNVVWDVAGGSDKDGTQVGYLSATKMRS